MVVALNCVGQQSEARLLVDMVSIPARSLLLRLLPLLLLMTMWQWLSVSVGSLGTPVDSAEGQQRRGGAGVLIDLPR